MAHAVLVGVAAHEQTAAAVHALAGLGLGLVFTLGLLAIRRPLASRAPLVIPVLLPLGASIVGARGALAEGSASAIRVLGAGALGAALVLSAAACVLATSAAAGAARLRAGGTTLAALLLGSLGIAAVTVGPLGGSKASLLLGVASLGLGAVALGAAALDGGRVPRDPDALPRAAFDAVLGAGLGYGAVALAGLGHGARSMGSGLERALAAAAEDRLVLARVGWSEGVERLRAAALVGLPLLLATAIVFVGRTALIGRGARSRAADVATLAIAIVGCLGALRFEIGRAASLAAEHLQRSAPGVASVEPASAPASASVRVAEPVPEPIASATPGADADVHGSVSVEAPTVRGHYDSAPVWSEAKKQEPKLLACYHAALARDAALAGRITVRFSIYQDGSVSGALASPDKPPLADYPMAHCVENVIEGTTFPAPKDGGATVFLSLSFTK